MKPFEQTSPASRRRLLDVALRVLPWAAARKTSPAPTAQPHSPVVSHSGCQASGLIAQKTNQEKATALGS